MKKIIKFSFTTIFFCYCFCFNAKAGTFDGSQGTISAPKKLFDGSQGTGTKNDPYRIISKTDLEDLADAANAGSYFAGKYFVLMNDITDTVTKIIKTFHGNFNGNNRTITLNINYPDSNNVGLFGQLFNATITNLNIIGSVIGNDMVGSIAGSALNSLISHCVNSAAIRGRYTVGGIVGINGSTPNSTNLNNENEQNTQPKDNSTSGNNK